MDSERNSDAARSNGNGTVKPLYQQMIDLQLEVQRLTDEMGVALRAQKYELAAQLLGQMVAANERAMEVHRRVTVQ